MSKLAISFTFRIALVAAILLVAAADRALAHAKLVSTSPAANEMAMPPPSELRLKFSEVIELKFAKVNVTGPDKKAVKTGALKLDEGDKTTLIIPLATPLDDGNYTVSWQVVSTDGHKVKGSYSFQSMR
jgi:methionine-rich copper-binding protein CopC